jgi:hypothetical protein
VWRRRRGACTDCAAAPAAGAAAASGGALGRFVACSGVLAGAGWGGVPAARLGAVTGWCAYAAAGRRCSQQQQGRRTGRQAGWPGWPALGGEHTVTHSCWAVFGARAQACGAATRVVRVARVCAWWCSRVGSCSRLGTTQRSSCSSVMRPRWARVCASPAWQRRSAVARGRAAAQACACARARSRDCAVPGWQLNSRGARPL